MKQQEVKTSEENGSSNVVGLDSERFIDWIVKNIEKPLRKGGVNRLVKTKLVHNFLNWARSNSVWALHWGIMCCSIEMAASFDPRYDIERLGVLFRSSPRQVDVLLLNGPISNKLRPSVQRLYEQIPDPKWVIAMGECTICGGPYYDSYSVVKGCYNVVPTDVFIPGCPVRPESLIFGFLKLSAKIRADKEGYVVTRRGRKLSSLEGRKAEFKGKMTHEVPEELR